MLAKGGGIAHAAFQKHVCLAEKCIYSKCRLPFCCRDLRMTCNSACEAAKKDVAWFKSVSNGLWHVRCDALVCSRTAEYSLLMNNFVLLYYKMLLLFPVNSSKVPFEENLPVEIDPRDSGSGRLWIPLYHVWMINEVCHTAGAALNPDRRVVLTLRPPQGGLMWSKWKVDGNKDGRLQSDATAPNKVTGQRRKEQRQPGRRYEEDRRSDSLKWYKGVFDFSLPRAISAAEQSQWQRFKVSPDNDQWSSVCTGRQAELGMRWVQRGGRWAPFGPKGDAFLENANGGSPLGPRSVFLMRLKLGAWKLSSLSAD